CDVPIVADPESALQELARLVAERIAPSAAADRIAEHARRRSAARATLEQAIADDGRKEGITPTWASACVAQVLADDTILVNEYPADLRIAAPDAAGAYFGP